MIAHISHISPAGDSWRCRRSEQSTGHAHTPISRCEIIIFCFYFRFCCWLFYLLLLLFYIQTNEALLLARGKSLDTGGWVELNWNRREAKRKTSQPCSKRYASNGVDARSIGRFESQPMRCFRQPCHCASRWNETQKQRQHNTCEQTPGKHYKRIDELVGRFALFRDLYAFLRTQIFTTLFRFSLFYKLKIIAIPLRSDSLEHLIKIYFSLPPSL